MNKTTARDLILAQLRTDLELQTRAALLARDEAISEESRPENQYDMHSQEAAYLAEGQARHAVEISETLALYEGLPLTTVAADSPVAVGALVKVAGAKGEPTWYFLGPRGGGLEVAVDGHTVLVVTPQSPLGRELLGKTAGAAVRLLGRSANAPHRIASVQ